MKKYLILSGILIVGFGLGFSSRYFDPSGETDLFGVLNNNSESDSSKPAEFKPLNINTHTKSTTTTKPGAKVSQQKADSSNLSIVNNLQPAIRETAQIKQIQSVDKEPLTSSDSTEASFTSINSKEIEGIKELTSKFRNEGKERNALTLELKNATSKGRKAILAKVEELNRRLLTPGLKSSETKSYIVQPGDILLRIGKRHKITPELIRQMNGIKGDTIRPGQRLKVVEGPFRVVVVKNDFRLTLYLHDEFFKEYSIGLGIDGSTPIGDFNVKDKVSKPTWWDQGAAYNFGDPNNPLGTRWITFNGAFGIHGTWEDHSIGKEMSRGCVRMFNKDVEEVFDYLVRGHSSVVISE